MANLDTRANAAPGVEVDMSGVPFRMREEALIPAPRYYDPEFFALEDEKLWRRVWQPACRLDEIPNVGDFTEYQILGRSYLIVRESPDRVKAFQNACRHRATALGCGTGSFAAGQIVCPFHGWRWNFDGTNSFVYGRKHFPPDCLQPGDIDLKQAQVGIKYGFVWINPDPQAHPFEDSFRGIDQALGPVRMDLMHVNWWRRIPLRANWKIAQEAFFESWHVMQTHPEMAMFARDNDVNVGPMAGYGTSEQGHGWMSPATVATYDEDISYTIRGRSSAEFGVNLNRIMWEGAKAGITERQVEIADEMVARGVPWDHFYESYFAELFADAARNDVPMPPLTSEMTHHCTVFPNFTIAGLFMGNAFAYRSRPTGPDTCEYDFWSLTIPPAGTPVTRPVEGEGPAWEDLWFVHQDVSNIERQQTGLRTEGFTEARLAPYLEQMILNWHRALDRKLASR